ncbi:MAG: polyphosphate polymerase domain-containing protein [Firmicutes bacterium]|nr:polyphosphate polymerase domain-containing protein [Bacillota bacterium]
MNNLRKELKYNITNTDFYLIKHNLNNLIKKDPNCEGDFYTISSIYFDDYNKTSYNQVKNGISNRWKYRIRFYNYDDSFIKLEKKHKINGLTDKTSVRITREMLDNILNNNIRIEENNDKLLNEFIIKMKKDLLRPIICIEYDRIPYVYKLGNVRITLDYNIRYTNKYNDLFNKNKKVYYLKDKILEVKYNELIPDFIRYKLELNHLEQISFSKFNNCIDSLNRRF